jgi:hypothetical protein
MTGSKAHWERIYLDIVHYDAARLMAEPEPEFELIEQSPVPHLTAANRRIPSGTPDQ